MNRKKPVLNKILPDKKEEEEKICMILKLGLLLALKDREIITQHQFELAEKQLR